MMMNKQFKYQFKLQVQKVYLRIPSECNVQIWWRRGKGKTTTKNPVKLKGGQSYFKVTQPLAIQGKCLFHNGQFQSKQSLIQIVIFNYDNTTKLGGSCVVDLTKIISATNISMNHCQNFELPLENTPDKNAKIIFTLSVKFLGECSQDSMADISFQANTHNQTCDMTFRPSSRQRKPSQRNNSGQNFFKQPQSPFHLQNRQMQVRNDNYPLPSKPGERPLQFSFNPTVKNDPQRQRQNKAQMEMISELRQQINDKSKQIQTLKQKMIKTQQNQRRSYTSTNQKSLSLMNQLNIANTRSQQLKKQSKQVQRQMSFIEKQNDEIRGQKIQLKKQLEKCHSQMPELRQRLESTIKQLNQLRQQSRQIFQKMDFTVRQRDQLKEQLFKKQSQYITLQDKYDKQITQLKQKGNNQLLSITEELRQLKHKVDSLYQENIWVKKQNSQLKNDNLQIKRQNTQIKRQNQQFKKTANQRSKQIEKSNQQKYMLEIKVQEVSKMMKEAVYEKQKERELARRKYQLLEEKFREKQLLLKEIEDQFHHIQSNNQSSTKQKDQQMSILRDKVTSSTKKIEELIQKQESCSIMISQFKVKIKNLQAACDNLQKQLDQRDQMIGEKQMIIQKAKNYVKQKQKEIQERDQFIANAKNYVSQREKQFQIQKKKLQQHLQNINSNTTTSSKEVQILKRKVSELTYQIQTLQISSKDKQNALRDKQAHLKDKQRYIEDFQSIANEKNQRIQDLEHYIQSLQQRIQITQEQLEQINRKNKGLNQTLEEVVKNNFQMEIQINIKKAQLDAVRSYR